MAKSMTQNVSYPSPHIGAFVLETLTLGMYGEPRHTLREYVQNSFDSIRAGLRTRDIKERGIVTIIINPDKITIKDNGLGVAADQAWKTLTSVGASKKDRQRDAGFRGIGRLAGMAYCDQLIFKTSFPGETTLTKVMFDCKKLLKAMAPDEGGDIELAQLLEDSIEFNQDDSGAEAGSHFFEVTLEGLANAPNTLTDPKQVQEYLSETVPVEFAEDWKRRHEIEANFKSFFGHSLETIDLFVETNGQQIKICKPYGESYSFAKGSAQLESIKFYHDDEGCYWGWIGYLSESAAVTDDATRGLRTRVRNIQVDGTELFEGLFTQVKQSYGRFTNYYVGEIHIEPERVIPNARRDGFEENAQWLSIKGRLIRNICQPLAKQAYAASQKSQTDVKKVVDDVDKLVEKSHRLAQSSSATYDEVVELMYSARQLRRKATAAMKIVGDLEEAAAAEGETKSELKGSALQEAARSMDNVESQARTLVGKFLEDDEKSAALRRRMREEIVKELLDIVNPLVDPGTYQKIRRKLMGRY
jgi:molecular chaperone HtpG